MSDHGIPRIRIVRAVRTSLAAPSSWVAHTDDGRPVHLRYRHGRGRVEIDYDPATYEDPYGLPSGNGDFTRLHFAAEPGMTSEYITLVDFCRLANIELAADLKEQQPYAR